MEQRSQCLSRPTPPPRPFDFVPWLAAGTVLSMIALITLREVTELLHRPLPRSLLVAIAATIWWTYWGSVVFFGVMVIRRWQNTYFRWRTVATMFSQTVFGLLLAGPLKHELGISYLWQRLHLTWPLHMSVLTPYLQDNRYSAFVYGLVISLIAWPLITLIVGMRYCSWFCFCGNLAENTGDSFRIRGPKGPNRQSWDNIAYVVLGLAMVTTLVLWIKVTWPYQWYDGLVGFVLADFVGISMYPFFGNRVWCRFFCPLRALLGWISRRGRFAIYTDDHRCIECGTCNRYCEMGIDIRMRARQGISMKDTECVACGACIAVCPRYALSFYPFPSPEESVAAPPHRRFRKPFRRQLATPRER
jgi:ferredoxin